MKKLKKLLVAVPLALASAAALTGCGDPHEHSLKLTGAITPDCDSAGNSAYYTCETCGKYYSDDQGVTEIAQNSWVLNPLGHLYMNAEDHDCNRGCGKIRETSAYNSWDGTVSNSLPEAVNGVIGITTAEQLAKVAAMVNAGNTFEGVTLKLYVDIDLNNIEWTPIGHGGSNYASAVDEYSAVFKGTFDGNNHTIYNLKITTAVGGDVNTDAAAGVGLFGAVDTAVIKNFKIDTAVVTGNHWVGSAVGFARGTTLDNVDVTNVTVSSVYLYEETDGDKAGALIGYLGNNVASGSEIKNCDVTNSTVNAARDAGQIVGCTAVDYTANDNIVTLTNNTVENVVVTDNNETANTSNNDNIKNEPVGSERHY